MGQSNFTNDFASSGAFTVGPTTTPAPIAHYRFDGSLANAIVGSPAGDLAVVGSPPTFEVGRIAQGANLTPAGAAAGSYLSGSPLINADTPFTIAAWIKPNSIVGTHPSGIVGTNALVFQRTAGGGEAPGCPGNAYNFGLMIQDGKWTFQVSTLSSGGGCTHANVIGPSAIVGKFYHVAGVYDKAASNVLFYIDGVLVGQQAVGPNFRLTPNMVTTIGNQPWASPLQPANSTIDDLRVYNSALSAAQISAVISSSSTSVLFDTFDGAAIDLTKWTIGPTCCGFAGTASVGGSELTLGATANIDTRGKVTVSGDNTITIEARMVGPGANRDTTIALVDVVSGAAIGSAAQSIEFGDTSYSAWGFHMYGYGAYSFVEVERPSGIGPAPQNATVLGGSTNAYMEYRLTITGNKIKMERGPTLANITESVTRTLGQSSAGKSFYIRLNTGGDYSPAVYDWVRVSTTPSN